MSERASFVLPGYWRWHVVSLYASAPNCRDPNLQNGPTDAARSKFYSPWLDLAHRNFAESSRAQVTAQARSRARGYDCTKFDSLCP
jgi:hypothetical protein